MSRYQSISYGEFSQRVRRHPRTAVLRAVAALNAQLQQEQFCQVPVAARPDCLQPFALAGVAKTAIVRGNEYRDKPVTDRDLIEMCQALLDIDDPCLHQEQTLEQLRGILHRLAYEQFGSQFSMMENVGRTLALLLHPATCCPGSPGAEAWANVLGVSLETYMQVGFAMFTAAVHNRGQISHAVLLADHVRPIFRPLAAEEALEIVDRWYSAPLAGLQADGRAAEDANPGFEKWAPSPLLGHPIVALAGEYVIPWPRLVVERFTPTGLYYIGLAEFGPGFPDVLGEMFQRYVGSQLALIPGEVHEEIVFGKPERRTVDFFLVTSNLVVLVEVKSARPIWAARLGLPRGDDDIEDKIGHAIEQIGRSADMLLQKHEAVSRIPCEGRTILGLVITLEPFHLMNTFLQDVLARSRIPVTIASSHELEAVAALAVTTPDFGERLRAALTPGEFGRRSLRAAVEGITGPPNPILHESWERFTAAFEKTARELEKGNGWDQRGRNREG